MLESRNVTKKYGSKPAVDHISMKLEKGHVYAMLGPNGSGKTTWMKMAAGLVKPNEGDILFNGEPVGVESRKHVAYMPTEGYFYNWMTVGDAGKYYRDFFEDFSMEQYRAMLKDMELEETMKIRSLSSGMLAKMKIALTMARDAEVYMLDEPFNGIDLLTRDAIRVAILERCTEEKLLLLSSHLVEEMEAIADRAVYIRNGRLMKVVDMEELRDERGISMADLYREIFGHEGGEAC